MVVLVDLLLGPVVVAGQHGASRPHPVQQRPTVWPAQLGPAGRQLFDPPLDGVGGQPILGPQRPVAVQVVVLADPGGVVHQADHPDARVLGDRVQQAKHIGGGQLAAQVQIVVGLEQPGFGQRVAVRHPFQEGADTVLVEPQIAQAQRIQHRRDAGCGALRVMRHHGRAGGPPRVRPRLDLAFQIVGMQVYDAGHHHVALAVDRARHAGQTGLDGGDPRAVHDDGPEQDRFGQNQSDVGQDRHAASRNGWESLAPEVGLEPTTERLTVACSTN